MSFSQALAATFKTTATIITVTLITLSVLADKASAQSEFGDTQLSYSGGVVYDDDLVPGRGPNQPYQPGGQSGSSSSFSSFNNSFSAGGRLIPENSPNLIGPNGRSLRPTDFSD